jgi:hypothetical protein
MVKDSGTEYSVRLELDTKNRFLSTIHCFRVDNVADLACHGRYQKLSEC